MAKASSPYYSIYCTCTLLLTAAILQGRPAFGSSLSSSRAECFDSFVGWSDVGGAKYNCEWYAKKGNCDDYGNFFENHGVTANDVCCTCGGGGTTFSSYLPPTPQPTQSPTSRPTVSTIPTVLKPINPIQPSPSIENNPVPSPSSPQSNPNSYPCTDSIDGWYDVGGPVYNCEWYSKDNNCDDYGAFFAQNGKTAKDVCCTCGGGVNDSDDENGVPTDSPTSDALSGLNGDGSDGQLDNSANFMTYIYIAIGAVVTGAVWFLTRSEYFK